MNIDTLKFDQNGLIPAVVQDYYSKQVLTVAYMNRESLEISMKEGRTCFFSRSRQQLWRKGETSGNTQEIVNITADCDGDALVVEVIKKGPACHTGEESCFFNELYQQMNGMTIRDMDKVIYPVCKLCRDHEKAGFIEGIKVGIHLATELT